MRALQTARTVVIDDNEDEAAPLLRALSSLGIGALYFSGDERELPQEPLRGLRVIFLDLRLFGAVGGEPRQYIPATLSILKRVATVNDSTAGIVCWAKGPDDFQALQDLLPRAMPKFKPAFVLAIKDKMALLRQPAKLLKAVKKELSGLPGHRVLWEWEQAAHDATTGTTDLVLGLVEEPSQDRLVAVLAALAIASGGKTTSDGASCVRHLFNGLDLVHADRLEYGNLSSRLDGPHIKALHQSVRSRGRLSPAERACLNTAMVSSSIPAGRIPAQPGNVYVACPEKKSGCPVTRFKLDPDVLAAELDPRWKKDKLWKESEGQTAKQKRRQRRIVRDCKAAVLEVSPACDYAQNKRVVARFIAGLLIPDEHEAIFSVQAQGRMYLKKIPGVKIDGFDGTWHLILNARYLFGLGNPDSRVRTRPAFRLRGHVLVDIQAWFAAHAARPGFLTVG